MMVVAPPTPVHWTTYVQTFAVITSTIGTFVYVYFTYHIMKWAVGQGKTAVELAGWEISEARNRKAALESKIRVFARDKFFQIVQLLIDYKRVDTLEFWKIFGPGSGLVRISTGWEGIRDLEMPEAMRIGIEGADTAIKNVATFGLFEINDDMPQKEAMRRMVVTELREAGTALLKVFEPDEEAAFTPLFTSLWEQLPAPMLHAVALADVLSSVSSPDMPSRPTSAE